MELLKKHYEKAILSLVLLGLAVAAALLPLKVSQVREDLQNATRDTFGRKIKPLDELDMSTNVTALTRLKNPAKAGFATPGHNLFNPIRWMQRPDGTLVPDEAIGPRALVVTNISPLYLEVQYRGPRGGGENLRYEFTITRAASLKPAERRPVTRLVAPGVKMEVFTIKDIRGPKEDPAELVLELTDSRKTVSVSKEQPLKELAGYAADLRYEAENKTFPNQRKEQKLTLGSGTYNIVAISDNDITLEDDKTKKRTTIAWQASR